MSNPLAQYSSGQLRAWADSRVISSSAYVDEMARRRLAAQQEICESVFDIQANGGADTFLTLSEEELIAGLAQCGGPTE